MLRTEVNISFRRTWKQSKAFFEGISFKERIAEMNELLSNVFCQDFDRKFELSIAKHYDVLSSCKSLDVIHIATALDIRSNPNNSHIRLCSFDKKMIATAGQFGIETQGG